MLTKEERKWAALDMHDGLPGTIALLHLTDGRIIVTQKSLDGNWMFVGTTKQQTPEDIMEMMNIKEVEIRFHYEDTE